MDRQRVSQTDSQPFVLPSSDKEMMQISRVRCRPEGMQPWRGRNLSNEAESPHNRPDSRQQGPQAADKERDSTSRCW